MESLTDSILSKTEAGSFAEIAAILDTGNIRSSLAVATQLTNSSCKPHPTTGILFALSNYLSDALVTAARADPKDDEQFISNFEQFVRSADFIRQVLKVSPSAPTTFPRLRKVLFVYVEKMIALGSYRRCIATLRQCMEKFAPSPDHLSLAHAPLLEVALRFNIPNAADVVLSKPVLEVDTMSTGVELADYITYFYYSSMVHIACCRWGEALNCALTAISISGVGNSSIMLAAAKVYLLLGVITSGKKLSVPNSILEKFLGSLAPEYGEYAAACEACDFNKMTKLRLSGRTRFTDDGLLGLVAQTHGFVQRHAIKGLTRVYVTLTVADIASEVHLSEIETMHVLCTMIEKGEVHGTLEGAVVKFYDAPSASTASIEDAVSSVQRALSRLQEADRVASLTPQYLADKLRQLPNYRQMVEEYEAKQKSAKGMLGRLTDFVTK